MVRFAYALLGASLVTASLVGVACSSSKSPSQASSCTSGETQPCSDAGCAGTQTCEGDTWGACLCHACTPNQTESCAAGSPCGVGSRTCASDGTAWGACSCSDAGAPPAGPYAGQPCTPSNGQVVCGSASQGATADSTLYCGAVLDGGVGPGSTYSLVYQCPDAAACVAGDNTGSTVCENPNVTSDPYGFGLPGAACGMPGLIKCSYDLRQIVECSDAGAWTQMESCGNGSAQCNETVPPGTKCANNMVCNGSTPCICCL